MRCLSLFLLLLSFIFLNKNAVSAVRRNNDSVPHCMVWEKINIKLYHKFNHGKPDFISLLRPEGYAHSHGLVQGRQNIHIQKKWISEINTSNIEAMEININLLASDNTNKKKVKKSNKGNNTVNMVTGIYVHATSNVFTWTFKNNHGHIFKIHATPNHPFYVKSLKKFLPLSRIGPGMTLMNDHQDVVYLICPADRRNNCGTPYHPGQTSWVYNIEINQQHQYFVSNQHMVVHNCQMYASGNGYPPGFFWRSSSITEYGAHNTGESRFMARRHTHSGNNKNGKKPFAGLLLIGPRYTDIDNVGLDNSTYPSIREITIQGAWSKYQAVLTMPASGALVDKLSGEIGPGTIVYRLMRGTPDSAKRYMQNIRNLYFAEVLEPGRAMKILKRFGVEKKLQATYSLDTLVGGVLLNEHDEVFLKLGAAELRKGKGKGKGPGSVSYILKYVQGAILPP